MSFKDLYITALQFCAVISQACNESLPGVTKTLSRSDYSRALCTAARVEGAWTVQLQGRSAREPLGIYSLLRVSLLGAVTVPDGSFLLEKSPQA